MVVNPIIPIWLMSIICVALLCFKRKGVAPYIRQICIVILMFVLNLRIMVPNGETEVLTQKMSTHVIFVIDNTISMLARDDGETERLTRVKEDCAHIATELYGSKYAVISFHNEANLLAPFTDNTEYAISVVESVYPMGSLYAKGTSLNVSKEMLQQVVKDVKEKEEGEVVVFFVSDGEITDEGTLDSFSELAEDIDGGAVLGYGTQKGGQMMVQSYYDEEPEVVEDYSDYPSKPAVSCIDEDNLKKIAKDLQLTYIHMTQSSDVDFVLKDIRKKAQVTSEGKKIEGRKDIYYIFVLPLLLLLIYDVIAIRRSV